MQELDITWKRAAILWWSIFWRCVIGGVVTIFAINMTANELVNVFHIGDAVIPVLFAAYMPVLPVWGVIGVRMALRKRRNGYRILMVRI
jgi:hypothetical protein